MNKSHLPYTQTDFRGLYDRGLTDSIPDQFFSDSRNLKFTDGEVSSRDGSELANTINNVVRFWVYKRLGETPRKLVLDNTGKIFDSLDLSTPIWNDSDIVDFSMVNYNNRAYLTPHTRSKGATGKSLIVYEGSGTARLAAGPPPSGFTLTAVESATSGNCEAGIHLVAVVNVTSSGFITAPGPAVFAQVVSTGDFKIDVGSISAGPAGTVARIVLATKSIPPDLFNGNQYGYELFFVPNGTINDNATTTLKINFYDSDLLDSADYLIDNLSTIPAGLGIGVYAGRLMSWGEDGFQFTIRLSQQQQPEAFSSFSGFVNIDPSDAASGIRNCTESRSNLIIWTSNRIYGTSDNGSDPNTWKVESVDKSSGTECFGIATVLDARGTNTDRIFYADRSGLISFEGYAKRPELSYNIEGIWKRINKAKFNLIQVIDDAINHRLFISVPLDSAVAISHILYADYSEAFTVYQTLDERKFKWDLWTLPTAVTSMMGDLDSVTSLPTIYVSLAAGNIYAMKEGLRDDFSNAIDSYAQFALKTADTNWVCHFGRLVFRMIGSGNLQLTLSGEDGVDAVSPPSLPLSLTSGYEPERKINFINAKCSVKVRVNQIGEYFTISKLTVWAKTLWLQRPA